MPGFALAIEHDPVTLERGGSALNSACHSQPQLVMLPPAQRIVRTAFKKSPTVSEMTRELGVTIHGNDGSGMAMTDVTRRFVAEISHDFAG